MVILLFAKIVYRLSPIYLRFKRRSVMKKTSIAIFATSLLALTVTTIEVRSADPTTTTPTTTSTTTTTTATATTKKKGGVGHEAKAIGGDFKKGTETVFKDLGKGAKKVGTGIDTGAKDTVKGAEDVGSKTKSGFSKLTHHKKTGKPSATVPTTTSSTTDQSSQ